MTPSKILILDDDAVTVRALARAMRSRDVDVVSTDSPYELHELLERERPDLALIDVQLPGINGDVAIRIMQRHGNEGPCPLVLYSSLPPRELGVLVRTSGAAGYIPKTGDPDELLEMIRHYVGRS